LATKDRIGSSGGTRTYGRPEIALVNMNEKPTLLKNVGNLVA
jgi:hypothetical protein